MPLPTFTSHFAWGVARVEFKGHAAFLGDSLSSALSTTTVGLQAPLQHDGASLLEFREDALGGLPECLYEALHGPSLGPTHWRRRDGGAEGLCAHVLAMCVLLLAAAACSA